MDPSRGPSPDAPLAEPERYALVVRIEGEGEARFLVLRDGPEGPARLPALDPPHPDEGLEAAVRGRLHGLAGLRLEGEPRLSEERVPARLPVRRLGRPRLGWRRALAARASGEPDAARGAAALEVAEARVALGTDAERLLFDAGVALLAR